MNRSNLRFLFTLIFLAWVQLSKMVGQTTEVEVKGFRLEALTPHFSRLGWDAVPLNACGERVGYSVFRDNSDHFLKSAEKQLANAITTTTFIARVPEASHPYYCQVIAVKVSTQCTNGEDPKAQFYLGEAYYYDKVYPQGFRQAATWFGLTVPYGTCGTALRDIHNGSCGLFLSLLREQASFSEFTHRDGDVDV
jgi:hypothetical protein